MDGMPQERRALPTWAKVVLFALLAALVLAGGAVGFRYVNLQLALRRAHGEFLKKQFTRAEFWANGALRIEPTNVGATRLMAEINEAQDRPAALYWRIRAAQLEPANPGNIMAWAKSALRFGQTDLALRALKSLKADVAAKSAEYEELMAGCALASHATRDAESHFMKAMEIDPGNPLHRVNLEAFRLGNAPDPEARKIAASALEGMLADPKVSLVAVRALLSDALRHKDGTEGGTVRDEVALNP